MQPHRTNINSMTKKKTHNPKQKNPYQPHSYLFPFQTLRKLSSSCALGTEYACSAMV